MKKYVISILALIFFSTVNFVNAIGLDDIGFWTAPQGSILDWWWVTLIGVLTLIQWILLRAVLPIIVVWTALYIAYHLLTAEGDETRMKQAWKSLAYSAIALVIVALSYAMISILSTIKL
jgi:hypothetical protein